MSNSRTPLPIVSEIAPPRTDVWLSDCILEAGCQVFAELQELTNKGWEDKGLDEHFSQQRKVSAAPSSFQNEQFWLQTMKKSIREMDSYLDFVPKMTAGLRFLDLGCAPGGYSLYVLQSNRSAVGTGITLPAHEGGHEFMIRGHLTNRYTVHFADVTTYDLPLDPNSIATSDARGLPFKPESFQLVILDGHCLHTRPYDSHTPHLLLVSQLIIALQSVTHHGTIFTKLSKPGRDIAARVLFILDSVSASLETIKPNTIHGNRGTFYAVAEGVDRRSLVLEEFVRKLKGFREEILQDPSMNCNEGWDRVVPLEVLKESFIPRLIQLGTPVWTVQKEHLIRFFRRKGIVL